MSRRLLLLLSVFLLLPGCGKQGPRKVYKVQLQVYYGEQPAKGALVVLYPLEDTDTIPLRPRGEVNAEGLVEFTTYAGGDGVPEGEYQVSVQWLQFGERPEGSNPDSDPPSVDFLGGRYKDRAHSGLRVSVPKGGGELPRIVLR